MATTLSVTLPVSAATGVATRGKVAYKDSAEAAMIRRAQKGDEFAFQQIVERYQSKVFSVIYGILRRRNDAEDIAQQVFTKIYTSLSGFDFRSSFMTWVYKITVNECYDYLRKKKVRKLVYESDLGEEDERSIENSHLATDQRASIDTKTEQREYLMKLLERVTPEERTLLIQKEVEGLTVEELAEMTGINANTIKVKLFRARQKLVKAAQKLDRATA